MPHDYDTISGMGLEIPELQEITESTITNGLLAELREYDWFHGKLTTEHAEADLSIGHHNKFLVRYSNNTLILSARICGWNRQDVINCSPGGCYLDGKDKHFRSTSEMIEYYQKFPIDEECHQVLGIPCNQQSSGTYWYTTRQKLCSMVLVACAILVMKFSSHNYPILSTICMQTQCEYFVTLLIIH